MQASGVKTARQTQLLQPDVQLLSPIFISTTRLRFLCDFHSLLNPPDYTKSLSTAEGILVMVDHESTLIVPREVQNKSSYRDGKKEKITVDLCEKWSRSATLEPIVFFPTGYSCHI